MFWVLYKSRMQSLFTAMFSVSRSKKKLSPAAYVVIAALVIYVFGSLMFSNIAMFSAVGEQLIMAGMASTYFALIGLLLLGLGFFGSIFVAQVQLFQARDNDLLLSMPIKPKTILASRIAMIITLVYIYQLIFVVPALFVYFKVAGMEIVNSLIFLIHCFILPLFTVSISSLGGWAAAAASARMKNSRVISVLMVLLFIGGYMFISTRMNYYMQLIIQKGETIVQGLKKVFFPMYLFAEASASGNILYALIFIAFCVLVFLRVSSLIARRFLKITTLEQNAYKKKYKAKEIKARGKSSALFKKDLDYFTNTIGYLLNTGLGSVLMLLFAGVTVFGGDSFKNEMFAALGDNFSMIAAMGIGFCAAMNIVTAPSVSLESKFLDIIKSLPVSSMDVLLSKLKLHLVVSQPFIFVSALVCSFGFKLSFTEFLLSLAFPAIINFMLGISGLLINLRFPKFDWINETLVVKQSLSTFLAIFTGIGACLLPVLAFMLLSDYAEANLILLISCALYAIVGIVLYRVLKTWGVKVYESY